MQVYKRKNKGVNYGKLETLITNRSSGDKSEILGDSKQMKSQRNNQAKIKEPEAKKKNNNNNKRRAKEKKTEKFRKSLRGFQPKGGD